MIREQALRYLRQEIPYSVAVIVDQFKERSEDMTYISANIFVERETQKAIILGQGGKMIKRIGRDARKQIEELVQLNAWPEYSYTREELVEMLDAALAGGDDGE